MLSITNPDGTIYSKGQGTLTSTATGEMTTTFFKDCVFGSDGIMRDHGSCFLNQAQRHVESYLLE
jgi:hypothetical protein